ncbi:hypothetical protein K501DRAFT_274245 [Backusella circina FSU 941]|nr:hypothetical protein K501DRAFT_274245 [Backusella circina FSU 941]
MCNGSRFMQDSNGNKVLMSAEELLAHVDYMTDIINPALKLHSYIMIKLPGKPSQLAPSYAGLYKVVRQHKGGSCLLREETGVLMPRDYAPYELKDVSKEELIQNDTHSEKSYKVEATIEQDID